MNANLLSSEICWEKHISKWLLPESKSYEDGCSSQWCLTNPTLEEIGRKSFNTHYFNVLWNTGSSETSLQIFSPEHKTWISLKADFVWVMPPLYSVADTDMNSWRPDSWEVIPVILLWRSAWNPPPGVHAQLVHCNVNCPQTSSRGHKNQAGTRT